MFATSFQALQMLHARGFRISIARQMKKTEDGASVDLGFRRMSMGDADTVESAAIAGFEDVRLREYKPGSVEGIANQRAR